jgi:hypothetical protein
MAEMTWGERIGVLLWFLAIGTLVAAVVLVLAHCGGKAKEPDVPKLLSCAERVVEIVTREPTCSDRVRQLDALIRAQAECMEALTGEKAQWLSCGDGGAGI